MTAFVTAPEGPWTLTLYDALGRRVATASDGIAAQEARVPLDVSGLSPGVYVARLVTGASVRTERLVVVR